MWSMKVSTAIARDFALERIGMLSASLLMFVILVGLPGKRRTETCTERGVWTSVIRSWSECLDNLVRSFRFITTTSIVRISASGKWVLHICKVGFRYV